MSNELNVERTLTMYVIIDVLNFQFLLTFIIFVLWDEKDTLLSSGGYIVLYLWQSFLDNKIFDINYKQHA